MLETVESTVYMVVVEADTSVLVVEEEDRDMAVAVADMWYFLGDRIEELEAVRLAVEVVQESLSQSV
jgi:hypothetical protein